MRKIILLCAFGLMGTFTLANQSDETTYQIEYSSAGGWCIVYIYDSDGNHVMTNTSWQASYVDCLTWAGGQVWSYLLGIAPM